MSARCRFSIPKTTWAYVVILAVVVVGAVMREINLLIILAVLLAGPLLMSWQLIRFTLRDVSISRKLPRGVFPGQTFVVEILIKNQRKRLDSWALVVEDRVRNILPGADGIAKTALCLLSYLPSGEVRQVSYRARLTERGRYRFGPPRISTGIPFGLLKGWITLKKTSEILVYPKIGHLKSGWADLAKFDQLGNESCRRVQGPVEGDFFGLREWRTGDSRRWIHWRSSAKRQQLVVRQFEQHRSHDLLILLDLFTADSNVAGQGSAPLSEQAICFVATLVSEFCGQGGARLSLGVAGRDPHVLGGTASAALLNDMLEVLAETSSTAKDAVPSILPRLLEGSTAGDRIVIVAPRPTDLLDMSRFPEQPTYGSRQADLRQALCIDPSQPEFADVFSFDDTTDLIASQVV